MKDFLFIFKSKRVARKVDVFIGPENILVVGASVRESFNTEILQAGAMKGQYIAYI